MKESVNIYFVIAPLLVFGPLFLWLLYNFGIKELGRIPGDIRRQRQQDAEAAERFRLEHARKRGVVPVGVVRGANRTPVGLFAQAITYIWFAAVIGVFSASPPYARSQPGTAQIKVSLSHPGKRVVECRRRTPQELAKLPPNMRAQSACPRERWPVHIELMLDGKTIMSESAKPKGLSKDGPSIFYRVFTVAAGPHQFVLRLREEGKTGFNFETARDMELASRQVLAIGFNAAKGGFSIR
ncbi:MAG TPA: hypothetical protein VGA19_08200 [Rhodospirillales bacterium]